MGNQIMKKVPIIYVFYKHKICEYWTLDVSRTASYELTLVGLSVCLSIGSFVRRSVHSSVTKFSQDWIVSFLWYCT